MTGEGKNITEAQMQIEKLKNLKINRKQGRESQREEYPDKDSFEAEKTAAEKRKKMSAGNRAAI